MSARRLLFLLLLFFARARGNKETTAHIFPCDGLWKDLADLSLSSPMLSEDRFPGNIVGPWTLGLRDEYKHFETRIVRYVHTTWEDLLSGDVLLWLRSFTIPFVLILTGKNDSCRLTEGVEDMRKLPMLVKVFTTCTKPAEKYPEIVSIPLGVLNHFTSSEIKLLPHNSTVVLEQLRRDKIKRQGNRRSLIFLNDFIWKNASTHTHFPNWFSHVNSVTTDHYEYYKFEIIPMYQGFVRHATTIIWLALLHGTIPIVVPLDTTSKNEAINLQTNIPIIIVKELDSVVSMSRRTLELIWKQVVHDMTISDLAGLFARFWVDKIRDSEHDPYHENKSCKDVGSNEDTYVAVIMDTRRSPFLARIVRHFIGLLGSEWNVQIWVGHRNAIMVKSHPLLSNLIESGRIELIQLPQFKGRFTKELYNAIMTSSEFWKTCSGEHVLLFQTDSVLCERASTSVSEFLQYDFVGAPWLDMFPSCPSQFRGNIFPENFCQGNGGISMRSRSIMIRVTEAFEWKTNMPNEDSYFTSRTHLVGGVAASVDVAQSFSVETVPYSEGVPFAVHRPHEYLNQDQFDALLVGCPEASIILDTSGAWKSGHIRKVVSDTRWNPIDPFNGQFIKEIGLDEIWFNLGSVRYIVDRCDHCEGEMPCLNYAFKQKDKMVSKISKPYVCGMSNAYVELSEIVAAQNGNNWAVMSHVYHVAARSRHVLLLSSCQNTQVVRYALSHVALALVDNSEMSSLDIQLLNENSRLKCENVTSTLTSLLKKMMFDVSVSIITSSSSSSSSSSLNQMKKSYDAVVLTDSNTFDENILQSAQYLVVSRDNVWLNDGDESLSSVNYTVEEPPYGFRGNAFNDDESHLEFVVLSLHTANSTTSSTGN